ncbi:hypothetical protein [Leeia aquatica]|uniref:Uncharacterized protein n=1 Tax=Leeia aquatica TaxID=2725557 RepID=A0A847S7H6_9NEIS|nr:hypothetical protein [Leeia aquatica]NLR75713.1 hypothetical protein [Leeia aquatica]
MSMMLSAFTEPPRSERHPHSPGVRPCVESSARSLLGLPEEALFLGYVVQYAESGEFVCRWDERLYRSQAIAVAGVEQALRYGSQLLAAIDAAQIEQTTCIGMLFSHAGQYYLSRTDRAQHG